jgi:hypothetical protein
MAIATTNSAPKKITTTFTRLSVRRAIASLIAAILSYVLAKWIAFAEPREVSVAKRECGNSSALTKPPKPRSYGLRF